MALPSTDNASHRDIDTSCVAGSVGEQVHVRTAQLPGVCQPGHPSIVLHLQVPVWCPLNVVGHLRSNKAGGDGVDSDTVLCPLHGEGVRHVAHGTLGAPVRRRRSSPVRTVRGHGCGEDNGALDPQLDELLRCGRSAEVGTEDIEIEQLLELGTVEVQRGLVLGHASVGDHAVNAARLRNNLVNGLDYALFRRNIAVQVVQPLGVGLLERLEFFTRLEEIERVDLSGIVC